MSDYFFNQGRRPGFLNPNNSNNPESNLQQEGQPLAPPQAQSQGESGLVSSPGPNSSSASVSVPFPETATTNPTRTSGENSIFGATPRSQDTVTVNMQDRSDRNKDASRSQSSDDAAADKSNKSSSSSDTPLGASDNGNAAQDPDSSGSPSIPNGNGPSSSGIEKVSAVQKALRAVQQFRNVASAKPSTSAFNDSNASANDPKPATGASFGKNRGADSSASPGISRTQENSISGGNAQDMDVDPPTKKEEFGASASESSQRTDEGMNPNQSVHRRPSANSSPHYLHNRNMDDSSAPPFGERFGAGYNESKKMEGGMQPYETKMGNVISSPPHSGPKMQDNPYMAGGPPNQNPMQGSQGMNQMGRPIQPIQPEPQGFVQMRELKVEDALNYLDQVKLEFGDRPRIYNEFLEIMKNFKAHEIDTPGVIMRVSDLFRGYNNLILGFNTFLPDGFKISIKDLVEGGRYASKKPIPQHAHDMQSGNVSMMEMQQMTPMGQMGGAQQGPMGHVGPRPGHVNEMQSMKVGGPNWGGFNSRGGGDMGQRQVQSQNMQNQDQAQMQGGQQAPMQPPKAPVTDQQQHHHHQQQQQQQEQHRQQQQQQQQQQQENPAIEFDHAITYVTTIKKRFGNEPRTYQQFLEILHTYQKEQRGIREVLEQVSSLFADHPDLLKQFTYFLPEAVQEQAKERLHAAAAEAEARQAAARKRVVEAPTQYAPQTKPESRGGQEISFDLTKKQAADSEARSMPTPPGNKKRPSSPSNVTMQYPMIPETMVYNAGVERQFFDMAKEALRSSSRDGELAWAEFLKCMDLYAQEILSKNDMLRYMEDLLGKQHADLFEEFKRILASAGVAGAHAHDDAWHSVPLSEIDFSRCRRCTPSYRALPRDYPVAPFSGRSEEEARLLNDVWISLPDGSEESYTFRHMRKNQHEEVLFRCEDERFEIDMVIDSTATALNRLEPIADEIAMLQQKEMFSKKVAGSDSKERSGIKAALEKGGMAGKIIKYSFDKSILNTIHRHAIARIYGDSGQEMLDLMEKNPVVAIPVVVKRLKQKDRDFRAAREVLNRRWKELAEINYYKSIDHRSLTWRTIDKRATSTRTLAAEIKDRAAHSGIESEVTVVAKRDKAKEEFGSFYERTMGRYLERKMDLTNLPKPALSMFTPHYSMTYDNNAWAQRDAYRILSFALERGSTSPADKERCHRVWTDFLAPFFELSSIWMLSPAVAYAASPHHHTPSIVSNGDESGNDDDESSGDENEIVGDMMVTEEVLKETNNKDSESSTGFNLLNNQPIPTGASVSTIYGDGAVVKYRSADNSYVVSLPFGATAYLNCNSVLCTILPVDQYLGLDQPIITDESPLERRDDRFMIGPQSLYLFFRLHQVLIRRLNIARKLAFSVDKDQSLRTLIEHIAPDGNSPVGQKRYDAYLSLVYGLLEGGYNSTFQGGSANAAEGGKYEDRVRCLLGHGAYELATMDKLVAHILKHLQNLANDDTMQGMIQVFKKQMESGFFRPQAFKHEAAMISEGENAFAFQYCHIPKSDNTIMHVEFLGCITEDDDDDSMVSVSESNEGPAAKKLKR